MDTNIENALIEKKIVSPGKTFVPLKPGTRVRGGYKEIEIEYKYAAYIKLKF